MTSQPYIIFLGKIIIFKFYILLSLNQIFTKLHTFAKFSMDGESIKEPGFSFNLTFTHKNDCNDREFCYCLTGL